MTTQKLWVAAMIGTTLTAAALAAGCGSTNDNNPPKTTGQKVDKAVDEVGNKTDEAAKPIRKALGTDESPDGGAKPPK